MAKTKMIAKLEEIYEYTHPLVGMCVRPSSQGGSISEGVIRSLPRILSVLVLGGSPPGKCWFSDLLRSILGQPWSCISLRRHPSGYAEGE